MYKNLYNQFKHWYNDDKGTVWFYSDPHFYDEDMKTIRAPYVSDDEQIRRINSKVGKYDTLVILGDIGNVEYIKKIHCARKVLIMGNHDSGASNYKRDQLFFGLYDTDFSRKELYQKFERPGYEVTLNRGLPNTYIVMADNRLFDEIYEGPVFISERLLLSHEPINYPNALNIHGHKHDQPEHPDSMHWNMCAEAINYTPVCLKEIVQSGLLKNIPTIHRDTIDRATARKNNK